MIVTLQRNALRLVGCENLHEHRVSGVKAARPGLAMALEVERAGEGINADILPFIRI